MVSPASWNPLPVGLLRSAGLPFDWLAGLTTGEAFALAALADREHRTAMATRGELLTRTLDLLHAIRHDGAAAPDVRGTRKRALNRVAKAALRYRPAPDPGFGTDPDLRPWLVRWNTEVTRYRDATAELERALDRETRHEVGRLTRLAGDPAVLDALLTMSPSAHHGFSRPGEELSPTLRRVLWRYLQRFCGKAETGGHIGPINLVRLLGTTDDVADDVVPEAPAAEFKHPVAGVMRARLLGDGRAGRRVALPTYWAVAELAESVLREGELRERVGRVTASLPVPDDLTDAQRAVVALADGTRTAAGIAAELAEDGVRETVATLAGRGVLTVGWPVPGYVGDCAAALDELLGEVAPARAEPVRRLVSDIRAFAGVDRARRSAALADLGDRFTALTGVPAWKGAGTFWADRSVLHEESLDNVRLTVDPAGTRALGERLGTAFDLVASLAVRQRLRGQEVLRAHLAGRAPETVSARELREDDRLAAPSPLVDPEDLAGLVDPDALTVELDRADLEAAGLIRADLDRWPLFAAADLMLGEDGPDGPAAVVLSEVHHIWPLLSRPNRHLYSDEELGLPELADRITRLFGRRLPLLQQIDRRQKGTDSSPLNHHLLCLDRVEPPQGAGRVCLDELRLREWPDGFLGLHDPATGRDYWLLPEYEDTGVPVGGLVHCALPAPDGPRFATGRRTPRVVVDGVVVQRRRWDLPTAEIPGGDGRGLDAEQWLAVHRWREELGLPRFAYFITPAEPKPMFVDLASVAATRNFLRVVRDSATVVVTEMLPAPDALWLDAGTGPMVCELRTLWLREPAHPRDGVA